MSAERCVCPCCACECWICQPVPTLPTDYGWGLSAEAAQAFADGLGVLPRAHHPQEAPKAAHDPLEAARRAVTGQEDA